jgi:hypothetical protein
MDDISPRNTNKVAGNESNDIRWDWITLWLFMMPQSTTFHNINWMHPWPIYCIKMGLLDSSAPATPTHNNPTISSYCYECNAALFLVLFHCKSNDKYFN